MRLEAGEAGVEVAVAMVMGEGDVDGFILSC
jgi:hypothetical protein